jgi:hypothetical protein
MTSLSETLITDEAFKARLAALKASLVTIGPEFEQAGIKVQVLLDDLARTFYRLDRVRRTCVGAIEEVQRLSAELNSLPGEHPPEPRGTDRWRARSN